MTPPTELDPDGLALDRVQHGFEAYLEDGDRAALARALELVSPELSRIAHYQGFRAEAAEDLVQATVLVAIERAHTFDRARRVRPWLVGILLNKIAEARRAARRRSREREGEHDEPLRSPGPLSMVESEEVQRLVSEALEHLPPKYREVLVPFLRDGKGGLEIAGDLDRSPGTIRAQIHRGLRLLRTLLPPSLALGALLAFCARPARAAGRGLGRAARLRMRAGPLSLGLPQGLGGLLLLAVAGGLWWNLARPPALRSAEATAPLARRTADGLRPATDDASRLATGSPGATELPAPLVSATTAPPSSGFVLRAFERLTRAPVAGAEIAVVLETRGGRIEHLHGTTDAAGVWNAPFARDDVERLVVDPLHPDFATFRAVWDTTLRALSDELLLPLQPARPVGGFVVNEHGQPLAGARVFSSVTELQEGVIWRRSELQLSAVSDHQGFWRMDSAPLHVSARGLRVMHPSAAAELVFGQRPTPPSAELFALRAKLVVPSSEEPAITLRVRDPEGRPVPGARVGLFPNTLGLQREATLLATDDRGEVRLRPEGIDQLMVAAHAHGHPARLGHLRRPFPSALELRLGPPTTTRLRIVDEAGLPQAGVRLRPLGAGWDEATAVGESGATELELVGDQSTWFELRQSGVLGSLVRKLDPVPDQELVLPRPARVEVSAQDTGTGEALAGYTVELLRGNDGHLGERYVTDTSPEAVAVYLPRGSGFRVAVHREGYRSARSETLPADPPATFRALLQPEETLSFELQDLAGRPCDYGLVSILRPGMEAQVQDGSTHPEDLRAKTYSDGSGQVVLTRPTGPFALAISTRDGFALVREHEFRAEGVIRVQPWASLAGTTAPQAGEVRWRLEASFFEERADEPILRVHQETRSDHEGRFRFSPLPAGRYALTRTDPDGSRTTFELDLAAGERASLRL